MGGSPDLLAIELFVPSLDDSLLSTHRMTRISGEDLIGPANIALIHGVSFVFIAISIVSSLLLAIPVFMSISASEFLVRLFHFQEHHPLHSNSSLRLRLKVQNHIRRGTLGADDGALLDLIHVETRAEKRVKVALSLVVWGFWLASLLVIYFRALNDFLLVGTPWSVSKPP